MKRRIFWLCCATLTFIAFYYLIPRTDLDAYSLLISVVGAILFTFFSVQTLADFKSWKEFHSTPKELENWRHRVGQFAIIPGILIVFLFQLNFIFAKTNELKEFGERTTGVVVDGYAIEKRKGGVFRLTVQFMTKDGQLIEATDGVLEQEYSRIHAGQNVELIYSSRNPNIVRLLLDDVSLKEYDYDGEDRNMTVADLIAMVDMQHDSLGIALNKVNYKWTYNERDSAWSNSTRKLQIRSNYGSKIVLESFDNISEAGLSLEDSFYKFDHQFVNLNFTNTKTDTSRLFTNSQYTGSVKFISKENGLLGHRVQVERR